MSENFYGKGAAKYYDIVAYYDYNEAAKSIASCIKGKRVLELGIGTGLTAIPMSKLGFRIDGIDNSKYMLDAARRKISGENSSVRKRVRLVHQSASGISLKGHYDAVISQGGVLTLVGPGMESYLKTEKATIDLLKRVYKILRKGGRLIMNIQPPRKSSRMLVGGFSYTGIVRKRGKRLIITHIIGKGGKTCVKQTFNKFYISRHEFNKMASTVGFKIVGPNKKGLHYILEK
ncbi:MAG: class I SAM-dependent methyltransferase [Candidatus Aenigmarchaeota archaeon]|nr:class I SAM-dependent methyltransferase [Candidatus Aenigmarchaeota archaeon]